MAIFEGLHHALRRLRIERGLTQAQVAKATGNLRPVIEGWESGAVTPRLDNVEALLEALGADLGDLFQALDRLDDDEPPEVALDELDPAEREDLLLELAGLDHLPRARQRLFLHALEKLRDLVVHVDTLSR